MIHWPTREGHDNVCVDFDYGGGCYAVLLKLPHELDAGPA